MTRTGVWRLISVLSWLTIGDLAFAKADQPNLPLSTKDCAFIGVFQQAKSLTGLSAPLNSSGSFYYHCEHGVIWKNEQPVAESMVFRKDSKAYNNKNTLSTIKSRQAKALGNLLNDLISADLKKLAQTFEIQQLNEVSVRLTPRKRRLKRALKRVDLKVSGDSDQSATSVTISIVDRNEQLTTVSAIQTNILPIEDDDTRLLEQCAKIQSFSTHECSILLQSEAR